MSESNVKERQFEARLKFANYGESALLMMYDVMTLPTNVFFEKHKSHKETVVQKIAELVAAVKKRDHDKRKQVYDYFIEVL